MLKKFNLKTRMLVSICSVAFLAFAVTIAFVAVRSSNKDESGALILSEEMAYRYGAVVQAKLEVALDAARTMAHTFEGMKKGETPRRSMMDDIQKQILERNPGFLAVWTCWEPNALDGKDTEFADAKGHDKSGRYVPYWNRGAGRIDVEPLLAYDVPGDGDYYLLSKNSGKETILDPYPYTVGGKEVLLTSLVAPIEVGGKILGVAGVDIALSDLVELIADIKPFKTGYGYIVSNNATLTAHHKREIIGKDFIERQKPGVQKPIAEAIENGKKYSLFKLSKATGIYSYQIMTPIHIGQTDTPWSFIISIPMKTVLAEARQTMYASITIGIISLLALILVIFFIARGIANPIHRISADLSEGAGEMGSASTQISSSSQSLAEGASEQAASIEETSSSLEEMASMTRRNADNAKEAQQKMTEAAGIVENANKNLGDMIDAIEEITKSSKETGNIIKTIDEIAFQTNLLALNAAVEAARAGEAGAGFAVVAEEVRNLALRSAEAARNTSELIEGTIAAVENGNELTQKTRDAFKANIDIAMKIGELIDEIAAASGEQAQGISQVNIAVAEMDKVTQQNAANAEESAGASEEMSAQAEQMNEFVRDLVALVSGGNGRASRRIGPIERKGKAASTRARRHTMALKPIPRRSAAANPKQLISHERRR